MFPKKKAITVAHTACLLVLPNLVKLGVLVPPLTKFAITMPIATVKVSGCAGLSEKMFDHPPTFPIDNALEYEPRIAINGTAIACLLYTSDAADDCCRV